MDRILSYLSQNEIMNVFNANKPLRKVITSNEKKQIEFLEKKLQMAHAKIKRLESKVETLTTDHFRSQIEKSVDNITHPIDCNSAMLSLPNLKALVFDTPMKTDGQDQQIKPDSDAIRDKSIRDKILNLHDPDKNTQFTY